MISCADFLLIRAMDLGRLLKVGVVSGYEVSSPEPFKFNELGDPKEAQSGELGREIAMQCENACGWLF